MNRSTHSHDHLRALHGGHTEMYAVRAIFIVLMIEFVSLGIVIATGTLMAFSCSTNAGAADLCIRSVDNPLARRVVIAGLFVAVAAPIVAMSIVFVRHSSHAKNARSDDTPTRSRTDSLVRLR